jgi:hypothetical protein
MPASLSSLDQRAERHATLHGQDRRFVRKMKEVVLYAA